MSDPKVLFSALFEPRRVALIGASSDVTKTTSRPQRFLRKHGFSGEILPVNPSRSEILGEPAYKDLDAIPGEIDHAYILLNGTAAVRSLADCGRRGVRVASILAGGFADAGEAGASLQDELSKVVQETGIRLVGPNSIGTVSTDPAVALTANAAFAVEKLRSGAWAVVSQSGSLIGALLSRADARGIGFSRLISVGNEVDLAVGEIADLLVDDPKTKAILLFMETLRDGERLARAARRAYEAGKPMIAYKLGRSDIGQELAKSHTGAIAGSDATFDAFCRRHGIARVSMFESLIDVPSLLTGHAKSRRGGRRVAVATTTGGGAAMVVDSMAMAGLDIVGPPRNLVEWLNPQGIAAGDGKLVDLTLAGAKPEIVAGTIERLLADDGNDAAIFVVGSSAQFNPELAVEPLLRFAGSAKPFAVALTPSAEKSLALLTAAGVPAFRHPESCAEAMALCLLRTPPQPVPRLGEPAIDAIAALEAGRASGFDERRAADFFAALGVPMAKSVVVPDVRRVAAAVGEIGEVGVPVVLKILSVDIPHKTEAGGVALGIPDGQTAAIAAREIEKRVKATAPGARLQGFLVQKMERGLVEVILGYRRDPLVGPTVTVGLGGVLAEIYKDASTRLAPVDESEALQMIAEVKGLAIIRGYRNLPKGDVAALAKTIAAFSALAHKQFADVAEAEINPLLVKREGEGVVAVDGLVVLS